MIYFEYFAILLSVFTFIWERLEILKDNLRRHKCANPSLNFYQDPKLGIVDQFHFIFKHETPRNKHPISGFGKNITSFDLRFACILGPTPAKIQRPILTRSTLRMNF